MVLEYYPEDKKAYGKYYVEQYLNESDVVKEIPVMLDKKGYHVGEGKELTEEIKEFKFMSEEVAFTAEYLKILKVQQADYNFEVPSYSVTYLFLNENKDLKKYLEKKDLLKYGSGYSIEFSKKGNYYDGGDVELKVGGNEKAYIFESFNRNINKDDLNYKNKFLGEE